MEKSIRRMVPLINEMLELGRDEDERYQQLLWGLRGEYRKTPEFAHCAIAMIQALLLGGKVNDARQEIRQLLARVKDGGLSLPTQLAVHLVRAGAHLGMLDECRPYLVFLLNLEHADTPQLANVLYPSVSLAGVRDGDLEVLNRCAHFPIKQAVIIKHLLQLLQEADLLESFSRQQRALEEVLGPVTSYFDFDVVPNTGGQLRLAMTYHTNVDREHWASLYDEILGAMRNVYITHAKGPAAFMGHVVVRIASPKILPKTKAVNS